MHVGGVVDRRAVYHEEQAALREALELGTATTHADRMLSPVVVTVSAAIIRMPRTISASFDEPAQEGAR